MQSGNRSGLGGVSPDTGHYRLFPKSVLASGAQIADYAGAKPLE